MKLRLMMGKFSVCIAMFLALAGCSRDMGDLDEYIMEMNAREPGIIKPLPEFKPYESYAYQSGEVRDPFRTFISQTARALTIKQPDGVRPDINRPMEPLESFPLDTLRMVGTMEKESRFWALVRASDGTVHRVQPGNHLGQNYGKILEITNNRIQLIEILPDGMGGWIERETELALTDAP